MQKRWIILDTAIHIRIVEDVYFSRRVYHWMFTKFLVFFSQRHKKQTVCTQIRYHISVMNNNRNNILTATACWASKLTLNWAMPWQVCWGVIGILEQGEGISITQRVHYEWIMHCATSLDMQQSECQNSLEHTFFSPCSRISCLNKETRNPVACSFLHYDNHRNRVGGGRRQCQKCRYRW